MGQTDPGTRSRLLSLLHEAAWLLAYGGTLGRIEHGIRDSGLRALRQGQEPKWGTVAWAWQRLQRDPSIALTREGLRMAGIGTHMGRQEQFPVRQMILDYAEHHDIPRLNDLRAATYPGVEIYNRAITAPERNARAFYDSAQLGMIATGGIRPKPLREIKPVVDELTAEFKRAIRQLMGKGANPFRFFKAGPLRWSSPEEEHDWVQVLIYNTRPDLLGARAQPYLYALWTILAENRELVHQVVGHRQLDLAVEGTRISFIEIPDWTNVGAYLLAFTGPSSYLTYMQMAAARRGLVLNPFGLYRPENIDQKTYPGLRQVIQSKPDFSLANWAHDAERFLFKELGVEYDSPRARHEGASPRLL